MISSDQRPPGEDWLVRRIVDLERQVRELQAGRRLEAATIGAGGLTVNGGSIRVLDGAGGVVELAAGALRVRDTAGDVIVELGKTVDGRYGWRVNNGDGDPQIRAGELAGGGYGLEAVDQDGNLVDLATLAFGAVAASVSASQSTGSTTYTDLATAGPTLTDVLIGVTGRCLVTVSADILIGGASAGAYSALMSHTVSGASTRGADDGRSLSVYINDMAAGGQFIFQASRTVMHTGLTPGLHTFTSKYRIFVGAAATFSARNISVVPF